VSGAPEVFESALRHVRFRLKWAIDACILRVRVLERFVAVCVGTSTRRSMALCTAMFARFVSSRRVRAAAGGSRRDALQTDARFGEARESEEHRSQAWSDQSTIPECGARLSPARRQAREFLKTPREHPRDATRVRRPWVAGRAIAIAPEIEVTSTCDVASKQDLAIGSAL
jgi:hypothetical protein